MFIGLISIRLQRDEKQFPNYSQLRVGVFTHFVIVRRGNLSFRCHMIKLNEKLWMLCLCRPDRIFFFFKSKTCLGKIREREGRRKEEERAREKLE